MRTYITTTDGEVYHAETALDFVKQFKDSSFSGADLTLNQFMRDVAVRVERDTGFTLNPANAEAFLASLLHTGLVKEKFNVDEKAAGSWL